MSDMSFAQSVLISVIGIALVFAILFLLSIFIRILSKVISGVEKNAPVFHHHPVIVSTPPVKKILSDSGKAPAKGSIGEVQLHNVDEPTAAMLMAIVADQLQLPLNELHFKSIREVKK